MIFYRYLKRTVGHINVKYVRVRCESQEGIVYGCAIGIRALLSHRVESAYFSVTFLRIVCCVKKRMLKKFEKLE